MVAADREVGRVVAGRDLERARAEVRLDPLVGDDRDAALDEGDDRLLADEVAVALVLGVDGDGDVGRDRRRAHGRDRDVAGAVGERVADRRERVVDLDRLQLEVGERGLVERAPVDDPVVPVDPVLLVQVDEEAHDGADVVVVHREADATVVHRRAHAPELVDDLAAVVVQPLPHAGLEGLAAELLAARALADELLLDRVLRRDPGVVVARLHEHVQPLHPLHARERVADRELERMAEVELAGDVRRGEGVDPALAGRVGLGVVEPFLLPGALPALLDAVRVVERVHQAAILDRSQMRPPGRPIRSRSDYESEYAETAPPAPGVPDAGVPRLRHAAPRRRDRARRSRARLKRVWNGHVPSRAPTQGWGFQTRLPRGRRYLGTGAPVCARCVPDV